MFLSGTCFNLKIHESFRTLCQSKLGVKFNGLTKSRNPKSILVGDDAEHVQTPLIIDCKLCSQTQLQLCESFKDHVSALSACITSDKGYDLFRFLAAHADGVLAFIYFGTKHYPEFVGFYLEESLIEVRAKTAANKLGMHPQYTLNESSVVSLVKRNDELWTPCTSRIFARRNFGKYSQIDTCYAETISTISNSD